MDKIVEEVRRVQEEHTERFGYDLGTIFADVQRQQRESGREFVSLPAKRIPVPERTPPKAYWATT